MTINCISCGHKIDVGASYDDYEGPIRCYVCRGMMQIRTEEGNLKSVNQAARAQASTVTQEGER